MLKKTLLGCLFMMAGVAHSNTDMAYIPNSAGGYIFFTFSDCVYVDSGKRIPNKFYVYSTTKTGTKGLDGCYQYKDPFYLIEWNSGTRTNVNVNDVTSLWRK